MTTQTPQLPENDFGFTAVDDPHITARQSLDVVSTNIRNKLQEVERLILPLLQNLMKNPEKEYILWPNRQEQIQKQIDKILAITRD